MDIEQWCFFNKVVFIEKKDGKILFITSTGNKYGEGVKGSVSERSIREGRLLRLWALDMIQYNELIDLYLKENNLIKKNFVNKVKDFVLFTPVSGDYKGCTGKVSFESLIKKFSKQEPFCPSISSYSLDDINKVISEKLSKVSCRLDKGFVDSKTDIEFTVTNGRYKGMNGSTSLSSLQRGFSDIYESLTIDSKRSYLEKQAHYRGCKVVEYPKRYVKSEKFILMSNQGNRWETNTYLLEKSKSCPHDTYSMSHGERLVASVLEANSIPYIYQKPIDIKSIDGNKKSLYMDFYLPDDNLCIEYDGIQHFQNVPLFKDGLDKRRENDRLKSSYCEENDIVCVRIHYSLNTIDSVFEVINKFIKIRNKPSFYEVKSVGEKYLKQTYSSDFILSYYKNNTYRNTVSDLSISKRELDNVIKEYGYKKRGCIHNGEIA